MDAEILLPKPIKIFNTLDEFIFQKDKTILTYNKSTKKLTTQSDTYVPSSNVKATEVYSLLGYIEADKQTYLVATSNVTFIGKFLYSKIYKIKSFVYIPFEGSSIPFEDEKFISMLNDFLPRNPLYYSDTYDLTINFKNLQKAMDVSSRSYIFPYSNTNYCWNYSMAKIFDIKGMEQFIYPVINGFFVSHDCHEYSSDLSYVLIGRKDHRRAGMRFLIRGADANGQIANFVETEEIVLYKDSKGEQNMLSYIQIRGSIPLLWTQEPNCQLNPKIIPKDDFSANTNAFTIHMNELVNTYGAVAIINLIDKKNDQKRIGDYYQNLYLNYRETSKNDKVDFAWFDFHSECKKMKYENLSKLLKVNCVNKGLSTYGYTHITFDSSKLLSDNQLNTLLHSNQIKFINKQGGIFRTNCIDSLDRTNVVQSVLGRFILHKMMADLKISDVPNGEPFQKFKEVFELAFKTTWANHGDGISLPYSGTGALKSDFVRTGKRTPMGNIVDGYLSMKRFYINNFVDGYNQDCLEYFTGQIHPRKCIFKYHSSRKLQIFVPVAFILSFLLYFLMMKIAMPAQYEDNMYKKIYRGITLMGSFILIFMVLFGVMKKSIIDTHTRHS